MSLYHEGEVMYTDALSCDLVICHIITYWLLSNKNIISEMFFNNIELILTNGLSLKLLCLDTYKGTS